MNVHASVVGAGGHPLRLSPRAVAAALVAEIRSSSTRFRLWMAFLLAVLAFFAVSAAIAIPPGWEVTGTTPSFEWGLFIVGYVFFAIMTSGLCLSASLGTVFGIERFRPLEKRHLLLAILSLTTAFIIIAIDLHYPIRMVLGAVLVPSPSSPMWWMGVFYGGYLVFLLIELYATWFHKRRLHQVASLLTTGTAIAAPTTLGAVFGVLAAKPFWFGVFTPVLMIASALLAGAALLGIIFWAVWTFRLTGWERAASLAMPAIRLLLGFALVAVSVLLVRHVVAGYLSDTVGAREAVVALLAGPLAIPFWVRVGAGLVLPLLIVVSPAGRSLKGVFAASLLVLPMVFLDRYIFVAGGQVAPITTISGHVSEPYAMYFPSIVEIGVVFGGAAFMALCYTLAERYLDMREAPEGHPPIPISRIRGGLAARRQLLAGWTGPATDHVAAGLRGRFARRARVAPAAEIAPVTRIEGAEAAPAPAARQGGAL